jgi:sugar-specific transcriptional regulator TrmB
MSKSLDEEFAIYLHEMGLSEYEASTYLGTLQLGSSTAKEISNVSDVPQSRVYDVLEQLKEKGFVTVQPGRPKKFGPIEPQYAVDQYTKYKRERLEEDLHQTKEVGKSFIDELDRQQFQYRQNEEIDVFWSYKGKNFILEQFGQYCESATDEIRMITMDNSMRRMVTTHKEILRERHEHGVDIRIVVPETVDPIVLDTATEWATVRHASDIEGRMYLFDNERILISFLSDQEERFVAIQTRSSQLCVTLESLFELLWSNSVRSNHETASASFED